MKNRPTIDGEHYMQCSTCNNWFDMRDLGQVFEHEHDDNLPVIDGSKYNSREVGDNIEWIGGKNPVNIN